MLQAKQRWRWDRGMRKAGEREKKRASINKSRRDHVKASERGRCDWGMKGKEGMREKMGKMIA